MARYQIPYKLQIFDIDQRLQINGIQIAPLFGEVTIFIEDVRDSTAHSSGEVTSAGTKNDHETVRHVLATVVANPFNNCSRTRVTNGKTLTGNAVEESFAAGCAIECNVSDDDVLFRSKARTFRRINHNPSAGKSFADVIVRFSLKRDRDALGEKCAETLPSRSVQVNFQGVVRQAARTVASCYLAA